MPYRHIAYYFYQVRALNPGVLLADHGGRSSKNGFSIVVKNIFDGIKLLEMDILYFRY
jgi:hypothetical protein